MRKNEHEGSSFDDFLRDEGIFEECTAMAIKRVLAWQFEKNRVCSATGYIQESA
jgi:hypothetical protein